MANVSNISMCSLSPSLSLRFLFYFFFYRSHFAESGLFCFCCWFIRFVGWLVRWALTNQHLEQAKPSQATYIAYIYMQSFCIIYMYLLYCPFMYIQPYKIVLNNTDFFFGRWSSSTIARLSYVTMQSTNWLANDDDEPKRMKKKCSGRSHLNRRQHVHIYIYNIVS